MNTQQLFNIAEKNNITIIYSHLPHNESCSIKAQEDYYVGIDPSLSDIEEKIHLAHEVGHCVTGSMYNLYAPLDNRAKHENRADAWAIKKLIPIKKLTAAVKKGYERWELAEIFNVSDKFLEKAIKYYYDKGVDFNADL